MVCISMLNDIIGMIPGSVICMNLAILPAPSTLAASYSEEGICFRPARNTTMDDPNCHTANREMVKSVYLGLPSHDTP